MYIVNKNIFYYSPSIVIDLSYYYPCNSINIPWSIVWHSGAGITDTASGAVRQSRDPVVVTLKPSRRNPMQGILIACTGLECSAVCLSSLAGVYSLL